MFACKVVSVTKTIANSVEYVFMQQLVEFSIGSKMAIFCDHLGIRYELRYVTSDTILIEEYTLRFAVHKCIIKIHDGLK